MENVENLCKRHGVPTPVELIDDEPGHEFYYSLNIKSESHQVITKVSRIRHCIRSIKVLKDREIWLIVAKKHCDRIVKQANPDTLLDIAMKHESGFREPIGFIEIRELIENELLEIGDELNKRTKSNADKLSAANTWLDPLVVKIVNINPLNHKSVLSELIAAYPNFEEEFDMNSLKSPFAQGEPKKYPIARALKFIFEKKEKKSITEDAIVKRYNRLKIW